MGEEQRVSTYFLAVSEAGRGGSSGHVHQGTGYDIRASGMRSCLMAGHLFPMVKARDQMSQGGGLKRQKGSEGLIALVSIGLCHYHTTTP